MLLKIISTVFVFLIIATTAYGSTTISEKKLSPDMQSQNTSPTPPIPNDPVFSAQQWLIGSLTSDGILLGRYTCQSDAELMSDASLVTDVLGDVLLGSLENFLGFSVDLEIEVDLIDARFDIVQQTSTEALVQLSGQVIVAIGGSFQVNDLDGFLYLVYERERWKVCQLTYTDGLESETTTQTMDKVLHNIDWIPIEQDFDGVTMVQVPPGCFVMGSIDGNEDELPVNQVCFDEPFWIDKYEVTQGDFERLGGVALIQSRFTGERLPQEKITWFEARDFCELRGGRLPTEAEWEYAARGPDDLIYPWGNEFVPENVVYEGNSDYRTAEVGSKADDVSWVGAYDLGGNVSEWVSSMYWSYPYDEMDGREQLDIKEPALARVLRGGSAFVGDDYVRLTTRTAIGAGDYYLELGFRCAADSAGPQQRVRRNIDWTTVEQDFDGVTMVQVPAGCFHMGSTQEQLDYAVSLGASLSLVQNETPVTQICFDEPFWIDKYEVTQGDFERLDGVAATENWFVGERRPRENVTWLEAREFCEQKRGGRLPTEAEWEYTARGPDNLIYPWGNEFIPENVVYGGNSNEQTAEIGSKAGDVSWVGVYDLSGNVSEWVSSLYLPYDSAADRENYSDASNPRVLRGGSFEYNTVGYLRAAVRDYGGPSVDSGSALFLGFRCARSY